MLKIVVETREEWISPKQVWPLSWIILAMTLFKAQCNFVICKDFFLLNLLKVVSAKKNHFPKSLRIEISSREAPPQVLSKLKNDGAKKFDSQNFKTLWNWQCGMFKFRTFHRTLTAVVWEHWTAGWAVPTLKQSKAYHRSAFWKNWSVISPDCTLRVCTTPTAL